jgi:hypothetical protein
LIVGRRILGSAAIVGIALGSLGTQMLQGQKSPTGYYIAEVFECVSS